MAILTSAIKLIIFGGTSSASGSGGGGGTGGNGTMDFSNADDSALIVLLEDI